MRAMMDRQSEEQVPLARTPQSKSGAARSEKNALWPARWATAGAAAWALLAVLARISVVQIGMIELIFLFAPLVIVPLGMELSRVSDGASTLIGRRLRTLAQMMQPLGSVLVVLAFWLPVGKWAGVAASGWLIVCAVGATAGISNLVPFAPLGVGTTRAAIAEIAAAISQIDLVVGASWLVTSRLGMRPMGIQEPIGLLTAVHFHFAGFATAMIASATARFAGGRGTWLRRVVLLVIAMPYVVAAGFVISPMLKMVAAVIFSVSVAGLATFVWNSAVEDSRARGFLRTAAGAVFAGVILAGGYAIADFLGSDALPIPRMASTHGILNGLGFCLLGLLGWLIEWEQRNRDTSVA